MRIVTLILVAFMTGATSSADILQIQCSGMRGHVFYAEENLVLEGDGGWETDQITDGETVVSVDTDSLELTYMFKDASGTWHNPLMNDGELRLLSVDPIDTSFQFGVFYSDMTIELVTLTELESDTPMMILVKTRNGPAFTSGSVYVAECIHPKPTWSE